MAGSRRSAEDDLRDFARLQVRAGLLDDATAEREVRDAVAAELPGTDSDVLARAWLAAARKELLAEQATWPEQTDHDRLVGVFEECEAHGVRVLQGVDDHWTAQAALDRAGGTLEGVLWFTQPDVWHAIDHGMLEVNLWHASGANAAPGDALLASVVACFARHGLEAHFDEGRIEVAAHWHRRR